MDMSKYIKKCPRYRTEKKRDMYADPGATVPIMSTENDHDMNQSFNTNAPTVATDERRSFTPTTT
jgi:hypothetical protein